MTVASIALIALGAVSVALNLWQWISGLRFPLKVPACGSDFFPPVSVLKPLRGCDSETEKCLESWFGQAYAGDWEILLGVGDAADPVCDIVRRLIKRHPLVNAELVIAAPLLGPNGKVSTLCHLSRKARHEHVVINDADVFAEKDFLSRVVAEMRDETVGLVNCFYILASPGNLAMRLEAIAVNADFWTQVLQALTLRKMDFALGAVIGTRRSVLARIGGFEGLLELLADDYQLGRRVARLPQKLVICPFPVECRTGQQKMVAVWRHQLRWARTMRVCQPVGYFFSILGNGTIWVLLAMLSHSAVGRWLFAMGLGLRMLGATSNDRKLTGRWHWWVAPLTPLKDLAQAALWMTSFAGNAVTWSGQRFRVNKGGKLTPLA
jgi:ceramide glucosyltransferase